jgi:hypothetical protein
MEFGSNWFQKWFLKYLRIESLNETLNFECLALCCIKAGQVTAPQQKMVRQLLTSRSRGR